MQFDRLQRILLRANLELHDANHAEEKSVEQHFHAKAVDGEHTRPDRERGGMCRPSWIREPEASEQHQMGDAKHGTHKQLNGNCPRREAGSKPQPLAQPPHSAGKAAPPEPMHCPVLQRRQVGYRTAFGGSGESKNCGQGKDHGMGVQAQTCRPAGVAFHDSAVAVDWLPCRVVRRLRQRCICCGRQCAHIFPSVCLDATTGISFLPESYSWNTVASSLQGRASFLQGGCQTPFAAQVGRAGCAIPGPRCI